MRSFEGDTAIIHQMHIIQYIRNDGLVLAARAAKKDELSKLRNQMEVINGRLRHSGCFN
ncbi:hypothetical protein D3C77_658000 [compost metagenome]